MVIFFILMMLLLPQLFLMFLILNIDAFHDIKEISSFRLCLIIKIDIISIWSCQFLKERMPICLLYLKFMNMNMVFVYIWLNFMALINDVFQH